MAKACSLCTLALVLLAMCAAPLKSQSFVIDEINLLNYPLIKAQLFVSDDEGQMITGFRPSDFEILDNGLPVTEANITVNCITKSRLDPFRAVMVLDQSLSMNGLMEDPDIGTRLRLVKLGAAEFFDKVNTNGNWQMALTSFHKTVILRRDWINNIPLLNNDVHSIQPFGQIGTDFNPVFLDPDAGVIALFDRTIGGPAVQRFCIIITDGQPTETPKVNLIVSECLKSMIKVYAINVDAPIDPDLRSIAEQTGGLAFEDVQTLDVIKNLFRLIVRREQRLTDCFITWVAPFDCSYPSRRTAEIRYKPLGLRTTVSYDVTVDGEPPTLEAGDDEVICFGEEVRLNAAGNGVSYRWEPTTGLSNPNIRNPRARPDESIEYTVTMKDENDCEVSDKLRVDVVEPHVEIVDQLEICLGEEVRLVPEGTPGTYRWSPEEGIDDPGAKITRARPERTTTYYITVRAGSCSAVDSVTVVVHGVDFKIDLPDEPFNICDGEDVQVDGIVPSEAATFEWLNTEGVSDPTIPNPLIRTRTSGVYTLRVTSENGCTSEDSLIINVAPLPEVDAGEPAAICIGESVRLDVQGSEGRYSWSPVEGIDDPTLPSPTFSPRQTTRYTVVVESEAGCTARDEVTISVNALPVIRMGADGKICRGEEFPIQVEADEGRYRWEPALGLSDPTILRPVASPDVSTEYTLTVTTEETCTAQASVLVEVAPVPTADAGPDQTTCRSQPVTLTASSDLADVQYTWTPSGELDNPNAPLITVTPEETTEYRLLVETADGCQAEDFVTVNVVPAAPLTFAVEAIDAQSLLPGRDFEVQIKVLSPELENGDVREFDLVMPFNASSLRLIETSFAINPVLAAWTITPEVDNLNGLLRIHGDGPEPLREELILSFQFRAFLLHDTSPVLILAFDRSESKIPSTCISPEFIDAQISFSAICFRVNRGITLTGNAFALGQVAPNPARGDVEIPFALGFDTWTRLELINSIGARVLTLVDAYMPSGIHSSRLQTDDLPAGLYYYRLSAGPYSEVHSISIAR